MRWFALAGRAHNETRNGAGNSETVRSKKMRCGQSHAAAIWAGLVLRSRLPPFLRLQVLDQLACRLDVEILRFGDTVLAHELTEVEPLVACDSVDCFDL